VLRGGQGARPRRDGDSERDGGTHGYMLRAKRTTMTVEPVVTLRHTLGKRPCGQVAQYATPSWLRGFDAGEITCVCLSCERVISGADTEPEPEAVGAVES
jgi:hypothetical protein